MPCFNLQLRVYVKKSGPLPVFEQQLYEVSLEENLPPPQLLVDLNTVEERNGQTVSYYILNGDNGGTFERISIRNAGAFTSYKLRYPIPENLMKVIIQCQFYLQVNYKIYSFYNSAYKIM